MKIALGLFLAIPLGAAAATLYVDLNSGSPTAPYSSWATAATNIQDAIEAAAPGDLVLVTNGIYRSGGKAMAGDLISRVALDKAIIVQSVNGPDATIIEGNWNPIVTNGPAAVRCAWLTNGATLSGFTIRGGATRYSSGNAGPDHFGGGVWGSSTNANVFNCRILTNSSARDGGGAYRVNLVECSLVGNRAGLERDVGGGINAGQGGGAAASNLRNCIVWGNYADRDRGGGVSGCNLVNCALLENSTYYDGGAAYSSKLWNCTITRNTSSGYSSGYGAAVHSSTLTNCVIWDNFSRTTYSNTNYASSTLAYCLSFPLAAGVGNIAIDPQLLSDGIHVTESSPCRAAGINLTAGADIDGQTWANPPSIGCDEWQPVPVTIFPPSYQVGIPSRRLSFDVAIAGQSLAYHWFRNGGLLEDDVHQTNCQTANLKVLKFGPEHAGDYFVVASNSFGMVTSQVSQVVIHCADAAGSNPISPYTTWATAATNIQAAIDAANDGDIVLVTNGVYATGGKIMSGDLLNRVAVDKPIYVMSMNGYKSAVIQGVWDVATNGPAAVRCVWMTNGAVLAGFTIRDGATRSSGSTITLQSGGGVWSPDMSSGGTVRNCLFTHNAAAYQGGGAYSALLQNCILTTNNVGAGGGVNGGGGAANSELRNCTVDSNFCAGFGQGGGTYNGVVRNSIIRNNYDRIFNSENNYYQSVPPVFSYSCTSPLPSGTGNINAWPAFLDRDYHLPAISPCRGTGSSLYASGEDMDGEAWANPPSMGADEVIEENLIGPIELSVNAWQTNTLVGSFHPLAFWASITGRVSRIDWDFGDGVVVTNVGYASPLHWWTNAGTFSIKGTAYNNDNPAGVSASSIIEVLPLIAPGLESVFLQTNGFKFAFEAQQGARYTVQYATNLAAPVTWNTLQTIFSSPGGPTQITDPAWTNSARFYRVRVQ